MLVVEKGEPGREASWAAGGMLADFPAETTAGTARTGDGERRGCIPEFVRELEDESGLKIDLRSVGTLLFLDEAPASDVLDCAWVARALARTGTGIEGVERKG